MASATALGTEDLFVGVNQASDPNNLSDLEKKHLSVITVPNAVKVGECFEVTVEVGKLLAHPNEHNHFIEFIELYADKTYLARVDLTAVSTCPTVKLWTRLTAPADELRAYERCNLHGAWTAAVPIAPAE